MTKESFTPFDNFSVFPYMYGIGVIMGVGMFGIIFVNLYRALFVAGAIDDLVVLRESEDDRDFSADTPHHDASQGDKK